MILSGDPIPAKDALAAGLVDEIIEGDLVAGAVASSPAACWPRSARSCA